MHSLILLGFEMFGVVSRRWKLSIVGWALLPVYDARAWQHYSGKSAQATFLKAARFLVPVKAIFSDHTKPNSVPVCYE